MYQGLTKTIDFRNGGLDMKFTYARQTLLLEKLKLEDEYRLEKKYAREETLTLENKAKSISQIQEAINILEEVED